MGLKSFANEHLCCLFSKYSCQLPVPYPPKAGSGHPDEAGSLGHGDARGVDGGPQGDGVAHMGSAGYSLR